MQVPLTLKICSQFEMRAARLSLFSFSETSISFFGRDFITVLLSNIEDMLLFFSWNFDQFFRLDFITVLLWNIEVMLLFFSWNYDQFFRLDVITVLWNIEDMLLFFFLKFRSLFFSGRFYHRLVVKYLIYPCLTCSPCKATEN